MPVVSETAWRLIAFVGVLTAMTLAEALWPRRARRQSRWLRWPSNLGIVVIGALCVRLLLPTTVIAVALWAEQAGVGLFNAWRPPPALAVVLALIALDFAIYAQHVAFHRLPLLWRLHRMHHADVDLDATSGLRFHPVEIWLSALYKMAIVAALGAPAMAVLLFEIILNALAMFNHANLSLPGALDRALRMIVVTPDMHLVHHSTQRVEHDSNYGFNLSCWDRLFATYRAAPALGRDGMVIGLERFRDDGAQRLDRMLLQPLRD